MNECGKRSIWTKVYVREYTSKMLDKLWVYDGEVGAHKNGSCTMCVYYGCIWYQGISKYTTNNVGSGYEYGGFEKIK